MKTFLSTLVAVIAITKAAHAGDGYVFFDGSTSHGLVIINGVIDTGQDVNASLLVVTTSDTYPIATLLLSNHSADGDITFFGDGHLYDNSGLAYDTGIPAGPTTFLVEAWLSGNNYVAGAPGNSISAPFIMTTAAFGSPVPSLDTMPNVDSSFPEPSIASLLCLGAATIMVFRRRQNT
jgi:hypothetical protein